MLKSSPEEVVCTTMYQRLETPMENSDTYMRELNLTSLEFCNINENSSALPPNKDLHAQNQSSLWIRRPQY